MLQMKFLVTITWNDGRQSVYEWWSLSAGSAMQEILHQVTEWQADLNNVASISAESAE